MKNRGDSLEKRSKTNDRTERRYFYECGQSRTRHEPEHVYYDAEEEDAMTGIPRDRICQDMPEPEQGPDIPGGAQIPGVRYQLEFYRRDNARSSLHGKCNKLTCSSV